MEISALQMGQKALPSCCRSHCEGREAGGRLRRDSRPLKTTRKTTGRAQSAQCSERQTVRAQSERMGVQPAWGGKGSMEGARAGGGV